MSVRLAMFFAVLFITAPRLHAEEIVLDFEQAETGKPVPAWTEKGVLIELAGPLVRSKAVGRVMFFPHIDTGRKGILNAMATEQAIPVLVRFPNRASSVTLVLWGSTGCPALVEALDAEGRVVDQASVPAVPGRESPGDPVPFLELTVRAPDIAAIRFSGPRDGEFLAADEIRFTLAGK